MKRGLALILLVLMLTGCGTAQDVPATQPSVETVEQTQPEPEVEVLPTALEIVFLLEQEEVTLKTHGENVTLYAGEIAPEQITWTSQDETVATVQAGVVTAVERGETTVTGQYEDQTVSCRVICDLPILPLINEEAGERDPVYLPPDVEIVDGSFFDDAVFVGDSQCLILYNCATYYDLLGETMYLARNSYSVDSAANNKMLLTWRGQNLPIEEAIAATGANKVFIMLGINDVGHYAFSEIHLIIENWQKIVDRIRSECPDIMICIQSLPPVWTGGEQGNINNKSVDEYNAQLKVFAQENGCVFIDVAAYLKDSTGGMATCYCSDNYVHVNPEGVDTWVKVLKACTDYD